MITLRSLVGAGMAACVLALAAVSAKAATIPATTEPGDFTLAVAEDINQTGPLVVGGTTSISGNNVTLDNVGNDFNAGAPNIFTATGPLTVTDTSALRGAFSAGNSAVIQTGGTLVIDALNITGSANIFALSGSSLFDVEVLNAQNLIVSGTLSITAGSILFDFSDGGPADLSRLNVGLLALNPQGGVTVTSSNIGVIPLPATVWLALSGIATLAAMAFGSSRRRRRNQAVAVA
ncbi:MAG: hypothetical protein AAGL24_05015 [Pseudomonadota bacterium]